MTPDAVEPAEGAVPAGARAAAREQVRLAGATSWRRRRAGRASQGAARPRPTRSAASSKRRWSWTRTTSRRCWPGAAAARRSLGPYEIVGRSAAAAWAWSTWRATRGWAAGVALKALPAEVAADPARRERLRREARAAATITHPGRGDRLRARGDRRAPVHRQPSTWTGERCATCWPARPLPADRADRPGHRDRGRAGRRARGRRRPPRPEAGERAADAAGPRQGGGLRHRLDGRGGRAAADRGRRHPRHAGLYGAGTAGGRRRWTAGPTSMPWACCWARCWPAGTRWRAANGPPFPPPLDAIITRCLQARSRRAVRVGRRTALGARRPPRPAGAAPDRDARWWWSFHQGAVALAYAALLVPAWLARSFMGGRAGLLVFLLRDGQRHRGHHAAAAPVVRVARGRARIWRHSARRRACGCGSPTACSRRGCWAAVCSSAAEEPALAIVLSGAAGDRRRWRSW